MIAAEALPSRICGPTALAYDAEYDRLYVANRRKHNILVFSNASTADRFETPVVVAGANTGLDGARPVGLFLDSVMKRLYATTDTGQSVLVFDTSDPDRFDADPGLFSGNVLPVRVIRGPKTMLGQPANDSTLQSRGPFAVTVARKKVGVDAAGVDVMVDEAYVVTPGLFGNGTGLTPAPSLAMFNVSAGKDPPPATATTLSDRTTNTVPDRVVVNPLLGASAVALDAANNRLYVASFHANTIAVYNDPLAFTSGQRSPDRIIAGPATRLDHPIALLFRRLDPDHPGSLYVVNQSSHSVAVFEEGDDTPANPLLSGNEVPTRYIGPPEGIDPFDAQANLTEMVYPTGLAIDPDHDILYVSNRDATSFQDFVGRKIVAFVDATTIGPYDQTVGIVPANNVAPTWKIEGVVGSTDQTRLRRPAGLLLIPDPALADSVADDWLVVANRGGGTILVFKGVSDLVKLAKNDPTTPPAYNHPPSLVVDAPLLVAPIGLAFDGTQRDLYVSDSSQILAITLPANTAPSLTPRVIQGTATGLSGTIGLALDPLN